MASEYSEQSGQSPETTNPFIAWEQQRKAEIARVGLSDLSSMDALRVEQEAKKLIQARSITDEVEKRKVYEEVRGYLKEYKDYLECPEVAPEQALTSNDLDKIEENPIDDVTTEQYQRALQVYTILYGDAPGFLEFYKGYKSTFRDEEEVKAYKASSHYAGREAARKVLNEEKAKKAEEEQVGDKRMDDLLKNNAITQLQEQVKLLNERLNKLERYTQE